MQFEMAFIPALALTGMVYLLVGAGLLKNNIKQVYSRRTKREKFLTIGVVIAMVASMLLIAPRQGVLLEMGNYSEYVNRSLLWVLNGSKDILAMAVYLVCALPVIIISSAIIDEIAQRQRKIEIPFFFYVLLFAVESLFYNILSIPITGWYVLLLFVTAGYCKIKMHKEGSNRTKTILNIGMIVGILGILALEQAVSGVLLPGLLLLEYMAFLCLNFFMAFLLNRTSVLKKKVWLIVICLCYLVVFLLGKII